MLWDNTLLERQAMTTKRAEVLLGSGNYFHWEYNMILSPGKGYSLMFKCQNEITEAWMVNDAKAMAIIAQCVEPHHQTKVCSAVRAVGA
ncbi:LOW QUALITY PROTEIN: polyprotein [Phytophthora megakarya]|uniref:Polyprotein n=1 Tax=Phytophthora megakarya TaxID=4795 RepID=A0A225UZ08_9STRA|nr:LOW QUALITY PROTEIN: polyprotein [Phytophthora megakarya]